MQFNLFQLLLTASLIPLTAALQTIYLAYIASSGLYVSSGISHSNPSIGRHVLHHRGGRLFHTCPVDAFQTCHTACYWKIDLDLILE